MKNVEKVGRGGGYPAQVTVDLDALAHNYRTMKQHAEGAQVLAVVKANAYGAGLPEVSTTLVEEGATWFGVARSTEALTLRRHLSSIGSDARILTWLLPQDGYEDALAGDLDVSVSSTVEVDEVVGAVRRLRQNPEHKDLKAFVHMKVDVGMSRGGATPNQWPALVRAVKTAQDEGFVSVEGVWSHLSQADDPNGPGRAVTEKQIEVFEEACEVAERLGVEPELRHLGASAGAIWHPDARFDMVRPGIALYGLSPAPSVASASELGLKPVFRMATTIESVKQLQPGEAVSYGGTWVAEEPHWVGLLPIGYADGVPRSLSSGGPFKTIADEELISTPVLGRVCMDQIVIDLGNGPQPLANLGDEVTLFGDGTVGEPTVEEWAERMNSINYEVIAALPGGLPRRYLPVKGNNS